MMPHRLLPLALAVALIPATTFADAPAAPDAPAATASSQACGDIVKAAANGAQSRIFAEQTTIKSPASVTKLSCLDGFFKGTGLNVVTNLLDPTSLLTSVSGKLCEAVSEEWQAVAGSAQCGLNVTGFNMGFGFGSGSTPGSGTMCPTVTVGGGGPSLGSVSTNYSTSVDSGAQTNGTPIVPAGYPVVSTSGLY